METTNSKNSNDFKMIIGVCAAMTAFYAFIFAPTYFDNRAKAAAPQCWDLRDIGGKVYKINKCTGAVELITAEQLIAKSK